MAIFLQQLRHLVGMRGEIDADIDRGHRVVDAEVGHGSDLRVGNDVERPIAIARVVLRRVMDSTTPETPAILMVSPTLNWSSSRIRIPLSMSRTMFCAARPMATPATPAEASNGSEIDAHGGKKLHGHDAAMMVNPVARMHAGHGL